MGRPEPGWRRGAAAEQVRVACDKRRDAVAVATVVSGAAATRLDEHV